jgi:hypothetical protein
MDRRRGCGLFGRGRFTVTLELAHFRGKRLLVAFERRDPTFRVRDLL